MAIEKAGSREAAIPAWIKRFYDKAAIWWGDANRSPASLERYREYLEKFTGAGKKRILDLGGGTGQIAHCFACLGHEVVSVELSRAEYIRRRSAQVDGPGSLAVIEGNFLEAAIPGKFDVVCCWEVFGIGTDDNQKSLLKRIAGEWLAEGGTAIVEVYSTIGPIKYSGTERRLRALPGVPGSVDMVNRCSFDPVAAMWIDEWKPVAAPSEALSQRIRCYTPADFMRMLAGSGLRLVHAEYHGLKLETDGGAAPNHEEASRNPLYDCEDDYAYVVKLAKDGADNGRFSSP